MAAFSGSERSDGRHKRQSAMAGQGGLTSAGDLPAQHFAQPCGGAASDKRTYLVVIDDSAEARVALHFAARRAAKTDGAVEVLAIVEPQDFVQWGGVQAAIEEEQRLRIEASVAAVGRRDHGRRRDQADHHRPRRRAGRRSCAA